MSFAAFVVEGAFYDWAAVYLRKVVRAPAAWVGLGYAAFSIGIVFGRLGGDWFRNRFQHPTVVVVSWIGTMLGLAMIR